MPQQSLQPQEYAEALNTVTPNDPTSLIFMIVLVVSLALVAITAMLVLKPVIIKKLGGGEVEHHHSKNPTDKAITMIENFEEVLRDVKFAIQAQQKDLESQQKDIEKIQRETESQRVDVQMLREEIKQFRDEVRSTSSRIHERIDNLTDRKLL